MMCVRAWQLLELCEARRPGEKVGAWPRSFSVAACFEVELQGGLNCGGLSPRACMAPQEDAEA